MAAQVRLGCQLICLAYDIGEFCVRSTILIHILKREIPLTLYAVSNFMKRTSCIKM